HARPSLHAVDQGAALRLVERKVAENGQAVRMSLGGLHGECVRVRVPARWMDQGRVDAARVHLAQHVVSRIVGDLTVIGVGGLVVPPDVDLRIDDEHGVRLLCQVLSSRALGPDVPCPPPPYRLSGCWSALGSIASDSAIPKRKPMPRMRTSCCRRSPLATALPPSNGPALGLVAEWRSVPIADIC